MAPKSDESAVIEEGDGIDALKEWLYERVQDDDDIVIDDMQRDFGETFDKEEEMLGVVVGTEEWKKNVASIGKELAKKGSDVLDSMVGENEWLFDGFRRCQYQGKKDGLGAPHGEGVLGYENKDIFQGEFNCGILNRKGTMKRTEKNCTNISGEWVNGLLNGEVREELVNGGWIEGYYKDGVPHGFQREFGPKRMGVANLRFVGRFYRGVLRGFCWWGLFDNSGWLCGEVDNKGEVSGDFTYIYPDWKMAIKGEWKEEKLVRGQLCELEGSVMENGIRIPIFSKPSGPVYQYEKPSVKNIALFPLVPDPWEAKQVYVKDSGLNQGGEGLFAQKDLKPKEVISLYNGIKVRTSTFASEHMPRSDYKIRLNADIDMDIPKGFHLLENYCATLAHKANHTFEPNAEWTLFEHPRFGLIRSLTAKKEIAADQEVLVNYQMAMAKSPEWYRVVWLQWLRKTKDDAGIQRLLDRQYELSGMRIPLPESEILDVPEPTGVDIDGVPEEYLREDRQTEQAAAEFAKTGMGMRVQPEDEPRIEEVAVDVPHI